MSKLVPAQAGEMRLPGIHSIAQVNALLLQFIEDYNQRFSVTVRNPDNAHRALLYSKEELQFILSLHHQHKLSKNLTLSFRNTEYQLLGLGKGYHLRGATITVCEDFNGSITLLHKGKIVAYRTLCQGEAAVMIVDDKTILNHVEKILHPHLFITWRRPLTRYSTNTAPL